MDGQTSTALLVAALRELGADVLHHIPVRATDSHGVHIPGLKELAAQGVKLVVTCDVGVTAHAAAQASRELGMDFLITDHHGLPETLPDAVAVVNPQRLPEDHPLRTLSGVGVAYQLAKALYTRAGRQSEVEELLDLVALGLVADLADLSGDARYLAQLGLERLREKPRLGLRLLLEQANVNSDHLNEEHISFVLAPRLNAIGRLSDANPMVDFLLNQDEVQARVTATRLEGMNAERKLLCDQVFRGAQAQLEAHPELLELPILVLNHPEWHPGVVGIVASRLVDLYHRPAILLVTPPGGPARGSARSVEGIHITAAIADNAHLLLGYGGHPMAAGMALPAENISAFRFGLAASIQRQLAGKPLDPKLTIDAWLTLDQVSLPLVESLAPLAPFGMGNPSLTFGLRGLALQSVQFIGKTREHLKLTVADIQGRTLQVLYWQGAGAPLPDGPFDLACVLRASDFQGRRDVQVEWVAFRPAPMEHPGLLKLGYLDLRDAIDPAAALMNQPELKEALIWQEGQQLSPLPGFARNRLEPASNLLIWTPPPSRAVFQSMLLKVQPRHLIFMAVDPQIDQPQAFIKRLSGLVRYCLGKTAGRARLEDIAAACAHTEAAILCGLNWLAANGHIRFETAGDEVYLSAGGEAAPADLPKIEFELKMMLEETAAYRNYYRHAAAENLAVRPNPRRQE